LTGGNYLVADGGSNDTVHAVSGNLTLFGGSGGDYYLGTGSSMIIASGPDTISLWTGPTTVFGGPSDDIIGGPGSLVYAASTGGAASVIGNGGPSTLFGASGASLTYFSNGTAGTLVGGAGNETLASGGSHSNDVFIAGSGNDAMYLGLGADSVDFFKGTAGGSDTIYGFGSNESVNLVGYGASAAGAALSAETVTGGSTVIKLTDGTTITFVGDTVASSQIKSF
jgi:hypothetical protein